MSNNRIRMEENPPNTIRNLEEAFKERALRALEVLAKSLSAQTLSQAISAPSDVSVIITALNTSEGITALQHHDPQAAANFQEFHAKQELLNREGGSISTEKMAERLQISRQAVDARRQKGNLLGLELGRKGYRYPVWQIEILDSLPKILAAMDDETPWAKLSFFLNPQGYLGDRTPVEALRENPSNLEKVIKAAHSYGEHGA